MKNVRESVSMRTMTALGELWNVC